jgi:hypothetical protein
MLEESMANAIQAAKTGSGRDALAGIKVIDVDTSDR